MNRATKLALIVVAFLAAAMGLFGSDMLPPGQEDTRAEADSVWYHAGDVALLAHTNRPQLVEFFHPG